MSEHALSPRIIRARLGLAEEALPWLEELDHVGPPPEPHRSFLSSETETLLARLGVPTDLIRDIVDAMPTPEDHPSLWWILLRCHHLLVQDMGGTEPLRSWPPMPPHLGPRGRYLYVWVFLMTVEAVLSFHASRGIADAVSWDSLDDLGQTLVDHQRLSWDGGFIGQNWLTLHFRGALYQLGRLRFNRLRIYYDDQALEQIGAPFRHGDPAVGAHISASGPLAPDLCDASFRWAREFFGRHFPEESPRIATCGSWLLDPQLAEYLPATSNIIRFQRRFHLMPVQWDSDQDIVRSVFASTVTPLSELPQNTTLQRAIVSHLRAGRHWFGRSGWLEL